MISFNKPKKLQTGEIKTNHLKTKLPMDTTLDIHYGEVLNISAIPGDIRIGQQFHGKSDTSTVTIELKFLRNPSKGIFLSKEDEEGYRETK